MMSFPYSFLALRYSYLYLHAEYFSPDTFFLPVVDIRRIGMQSIYGRTLRSYSNQMEQRFDGGIMNSLLNSVGIGPVNRDQEELRKIFAIFFFYRCSF